MNTEKICSVCGKPCTNGTGLSAHMRAKHSAESKAPFVLRKTVMKMKTAATKAAPTRVGAAGSGSVPGVTRGPYRPRRAAAVTLPRTVQAGADIMNITVGQTSIRCAEIDGRTIVIGEERLTSFKTLSDAIAAAKNGVSTDSFLSR